jgi:hypothetical protein
VQKKNIERKQAKFMAGDDPSKLVEEEEKEESSETESSSGSESSEVTNRDSPPVAHGQCTGGF